MLGIECDGAQYPLLALGARPRPAAPAGAGSHGWIIHRIWSADWYLRPDEELAKTRAAIDAAILEWRERDEGAAVAAKPVPIRFTAHLQDQDLDVVVADIGDAPTASEPVSTPYREAAGISVPMGVEPHLASARDMMRVVTEIVSIEGPVHVDEVVARTASCGDWVAPVRASVPSRQPSGWRPCRATS